MLDQVSHADAPPHRIFSDDVRFLSMSLRSLSARTLISIPGFRQPGLCKALRCVLSPSARRMVAPAAVPDGAAAVI